ncbi:serine protease snake-like [Ochlerotatus camptorhynchus]|uniref:serine protease snake-like n=1 Tax=Ochlerotatus camptorhynchus TaxID=644619 RepID=UPI0031DB1D14
MMAVRLTFLSCIIVTAVALKEGDRCSINDQTGICTLSSACQELEKVQQLGVRPKICGYAANRERIVCCPRFDAVPKQAMRKCEQYCDEYRKLASTEISFGSFLLDPGADRRVFVPKCDEAIGLIVGGTPARPEQFPHIAALGWLENGKFNFKCGGSLISDRYVLTAGHCLITTDGPPVLVRLGDYNLQSTKDGYLGTDVEIEKIVAHPTYKRSVSRYNDIGLVKLNRTVTFGPTIRPACLWTSEESNRKAIAIGYGAIDTSGNHSNVLMQVGLDILAYDECSLAYLGSPKLPQSIIESQLCAHTVEGGKDTCHGDSGGPLQITTEDHNCVYYLVGVTSFGISCGGFIPGVYTKVSAYLDWIESVVW